jgi:hypothetical protein
MGLPSKHSAIWDQMEEDVAAGRWPMPSIYRSMALWYRGPRSELHRRAAFRRRMEEGLSPWRRAIWLLIWGPVSVWLLNDSFNHKRLFLVLLVSTVGLILLDWIEKRMFELSVDRYMRVHQILQAPLRSDLRLGGADLTSKRGDS